MTAKIIPFGRPAPKRLAAPDSQRAMNLPDTPPANIRGGELPWHHGKQIVFKGQHMTFCACLDSICGCDNAQIMECWKRCTESHR